MKIPSLVAQLTRSPLDKPCPEPWEQMVGDDRVRHCASCAREVYDLSAMSPREAELRLLNSGERAPCIRYARRADGTIVQAAEPRGAGRPAARPSLAAAAAIGVTLTASAVQAKPPKKAPDACVAYLKQSDVDGSVVVAATEPAAPPAAAAAPPAAAPPRPAAAAPAAAPPAAPPEPVPLGGAPPPIQQQPRYGTLQMKSKVEREVTLLGIKLKAPIPSYLLTPGDFVASVREPNGKLRDVKFRITIDKTTVVDLDKK